MSSPDEQALDERSADERSADERSAESQLRDIQALTDAALAQLEDQELLAELTARVRAVLAADTAAVLLLDGQAGQLIAAAAAGLEEEVLQGVRIPVGRGFAGRIAAEQQPVIVNHVDHTSVLNPILLAKGVRSLMGVPLIAGNTVIGVLHVGSLQPRQFTPAETMLLQLAGDRAAAAVQSMLARDARAAAVALQRSLVPAALPAVAGVELAARYVPGAGVVGGDWYDVFGLPGGELGVVIGDVAGSGLAAAVIMGRIRSALRAYALQTTDPAEVLSRLDRKMQHFEPGALATVLYAVLPPGLEHALVASAGHHPPVLARPGQEAVLAAVPPGAAIGIDLVTRRQAAVLALEPGTLLCLYTDGLVERPYQLLDDGLARLCAAVTAQAPDVVCASVMQAIIGSQPARDDIALLMLRRAC